MEIHVVQPGESLYRIAQHYGVPLAAVLRQNELRDPNRLTPGECILVPVGGRQYTVRRGDTLASIAGAQGTTVRQLWRDNPFLMGQDRVSPGQTLYLADSGAYPRKIVLGGVRQGADARMLRRVLPQLDYLAVASFGFDRTGRIPGIHAEIPVRLARRYGVRPVFVLTMQDENGRFSGERARQVLRDPAARANLIRSAAQNAAAGEWAGILLDFEYLMPEDRDAFSDFVRALKAQLASEKQQLLLDAQKQADAILAEGKTAAEAERQHKLREADAQTTALARAMCEKLLARHLTAQDDARLLDDLLEKAGAGNGN